MKKIAVFRNACIIFAACTVAAITAPAQTVTTFFNFANLSDGQSPTGGVVLATDGNFYGAAQFGGTSGNCPYGGGCGTVFQITPDGTLTILHNFCSETNCTDGAYPQAGLIQATDGNFYGTTLNYGANGYGTVFKITPSGTLTTLHIFSPRDGENPWGELVQATDGNFYGTTVFGGAHSYGTAYRITVEGTFTVLYNFCSETNCADGASPQAGMIQATDGNFYGTTQVGGNDQCDRPNGCGTVFKITPAGTLTTLHSFSQSDGESPVGLIQATDGNLYGTTVGGGTSTYPLCVRDGGCGTVFKITTAGTLTTLHSFNFSDGLFPWGELIQAADGNFYGTTSQGGLYQSLGTIFEITAQGTLARLHSFNGADGEDPRAGLIQASDGTFYGTTVAGPGYGTVFSLAATAAATLSPTSLSFTKQAIDETSAAKALTLKNSGTALLNVGAVTINGSSFATSANTCSGTALAIGKVCKISVTFTPAVPGEVTGTLTFTDNAAGTPPVVQLSGNGVEPATLTPISATYASQSVGTTSSPKTFTLTNNQGVALTSLAISTSGDFSVSATTCTTSPAANSKCSISVTFTPTTTGTRTGTLSVSDSAGNSPQMSTLTGTGK